MKYCAYCNEDRPNNHVVKCPDCKGSLHISENGICSCANCGKSFPLEQIQPKKATPITPEPVFEVPAEPKKLRKQLI